MIIKPDGKLPLLFTRKKHRQPENGCLKEMINKIITDTLSE